MHSCFCFIPYVSAVEIDTEVAYFSRIIHVPFVFGDATSTALRILYNLSFQCTITIDGLCTAVHPCIEKELFVYCVRYTHGIIVIDIVTCTDISV